MPSEIASYGEVSYSVTNLDSALTMLMAVYVYGEEAVKDTKQIVLGTRRQVGWSIFDDVWCYLYRCAAVLEAQEGHTHSQSLS
ncbi:hypothetical protein ElyMa_003691300 [Elysia marginata]|uniref:Uncharacterized protein n=1 Tax=Elysia marginata TaxID=1093978 RepID=A0AAV4F2X4_9GAST|nr:hypothetical protein ElyMa_003691300 [Elysia marginata]